MFRRRVVPVRERRRFFGGFWFWVAMVAIITNKPLIELVFNLLSLGLRHLGVLA